MTDWLNMALSDTDEETPQTDWLNMALGEKEPREKPFSGAGGSFEEEGEGFVDNLKANAPAMIGATVGEALTGGSPAGGAAGGFVGKTAEQIIQYVQKVPGLAESLAQGLQIGAGGLPVPGGQYQNDPAPAPSFKDAPSPDIVGGVRESLAAGAAEGLASIGGGLATKGIGKGLSWLGHRVSPAARSVMDKFGSDALTVSEASGSRLWGILENVGDKSFLGAKKRIDWLLNRAEKIKATAVDFVSQFGEVASPNDIGELFDAAYKNKLEVMKPLTDAKYNKVKELAQGVMVFGKKGQLSFNKELGEEPFYISIKKLKEEIELIGKPGERLKGIGGTPAGDEIIKDVKNLPEIIGYAEAVELRSRFLGIADDFSIANPKAKAIGKAKTAMGLVDEAVENEIPEKAIRPWREANAFYKSVKDQFDPAVIRQIIKTIKNSPKEFDIVVEKIFQKRNAPLVRKVKGIMGPEQFKKMQGHFAQKLIDSATDKSTGIIDGIKLNTLTEDPISGYGADMMKEMFSLEQRQALRDFTKWATISKENSAEGVGGMFIQLAQAGAGANALYTLSLSPMTATVLVAPKIASWLVTNKTIARYMLNSLKLPPGSKQMAVLTARIGGEIKKKEKEESAKEFARISAANTLKWTGGKTAGLVKYPIEKTTNFLESIREKVELQNK